MKNHLTITWRSPNDRQFVIYNLSNQALLSYILCYNLCWSSSFHCQSISWLIDASLTAHRDLKAIFVCKTRRLVLNLVSQTIRDYYILCFCLFHALLIPCNILKERRGNTSLICVICDLLSNWILSYNAGLSGVCVQGMWPSSSDICWLQYSHKSSKRAT